MFACSSLCRKFRHCFAGQVINIRDPQAIADCYRNRLNQQGLNVISTFRLYDTQTCFAVQERPNRCTGRHIG
jgi:hypothetical protein